MKAEFVIINGDDAIAIVYKHETLGRIVMVRSNINPEFNVSIHSLSDGTEDIEIDMLEFVLKSIPEDK